MFNHASWCFNRKLYLPWHKWFALNDRRLYNFLAGENTPGYSISPIVRNIADTIPLWPTWCQLENPWQWCSGNTSLLHAKKCTQSSPWSAILLLIALTSFSSQKNSTKPFWKTYPALGPQPTVSSVELAPLTAGWEPTVHHPLFVRFSRCGRIINDSGDNGVGENGVLVILECR